MDGRSFISGTSSTCSDFQNNIPVVFGVTQSRRTTRKRFKGYKLLWFYSPNSTYKTADLVIWRRDFWCTLWASMLEIILPINGFYFRGFQALLLYAEIIILGFTFIFKSLIRLDNGNTSIILQFTLVVAAKLFTLLYICTAQRVFHSHFFAFVPHHHLQQRHPCNRQNSDNFN